MFFFNEIVGTVSEDEPASLVGNEGRLRQIT